MQEHAHGGVVEKLNVEKKANEKFEGRDEHGEEVTEASKEDRQKQTNGT